jgi:uncharacterized RDD family membrane protein YckC
MAVGLGPAVAAAPAVAAGPAVAQAVPYAPAIATRSPYGGFWIRVVASLVDNTLLSLLYVPVGLIFLLPSIRVMSEHDWEQGPPMEFLGTILLLGALFFSSTWLYEALLTSSSWQGTVGKRLCSLQVTDLEGNRISFARATGRFFGKFLSRMIMHIGFIMVAFTERKQGLHDLLAGTLVRKSSN